MREYIYAVQAFKEFQRYGLPYGGGVKAQPVRWIMAMDCINDAMRHADMEAQLWADAISSMT